MPKLPKKDAQETAATDAWTSGPRLLPEGRYAARLQKVTEREGREYPQWSWWFTQLHDVEGNTYPGTQFLNTSLSPKARGGLRQAFDALGYTPDSDTDEMIGEWAVLYVTQEVAQQGQRAGQTTNRVSSVSPFDETEWDFDPATVPADKPSGSSEDRGSTF